MRKRMKKPIGRKRKMSNNNEAPMGREPKPLQQTSDRAPRTRVPPGPPTGRESKPGAGLTYRPTVTDRVLPLPEASDRKSTRLNSSHVKISYAVFCLKKKNKMMTNVR